MILSWAAACGGASAASPLKYAAADVKNWPPLACSAARLFLSAAGTFGRLWLILLKSLQKWPVSLAEGSPDTAGPLLLAAAVPPEEDPAVLPPMEPPPQPLSMRQAPAAAIAASRGVDLMANMSCLSG